jgi:hypothetical protein
LQLLLGAVFAREPGRERELLDDGVERAVEVMGRALVLNDVKLVAQRPLARAAAIRDLPIPASPQSSTSCPSPDAARFQRSSSRSSSWSRPTSALKCSPRVAPKRVSLACSPITRHTVTGAVKPASACRPSDS